MLSLKIILASTRPDRKGPAVASWIFNHASAMNEFDTELLDLAKINLPFLDEPQLPRLKKYTREHTRNWSRVIESADAFILVTAEYNHGYPAPLKNALDYLYHEWNYKPVAFVSYGGIAGGTRAVQQLKQVVAAQKMTPVTEAVTIPFIAEHMDENGRFPGSDSFDAAAKKMLVELAAWAAALSGLRKAL